MSKKFLQLFVVLLTVVLVTLATVPNTYAEVETRRIVPPGDHFRGKTYGEWGASWWQAAFAIPVVNDEHPILSGGGFAGEKRTVFLAAYVGEARTIDVTIAAGSALFVPVINAECSVIEPDPYHGDNETSLRACANGHMDQTSGRAAELDGKQVQVDHYRVQSPLFTFGPLPEDNLLEYLGLDNTVGATSDSVDAGYYLLLRPLKQGEHTLRVLATFDEFSAPIDTTFIITVVPRSQCKDIPGCISGQ